MLRTVLWFRCGVCGAWKEEVRSHVVRQRHGVPVPACSCWSLMFLNVLGALPPAARLDHPGEEPVQGARRPGEVTTLGTDSLFRVYSTGFLSQSSMTAAPSSGIKCFRKVCSGCFQLTCPIGHPRGNSSSGASGKTAVQISRSGHQTRVGGARVTPHPTN